MNYLFHLGKSAAKRTDTASGRTSHSLNARTPLAASFLERAGAEAAAGFREAPGEDKGGTK